jgi:hypothetical protein
VNIYVYIYMSIYIHRKTRAFEVRGLDRSLLICNQMRVSSETTRLWHVELLCDNYRMRDASLLKIWKQAPLKYKPLWDLRWSAIRWDQVLFNHQMIIFAETTLETLTGIASYTSIFFVILPECAIQVYSRF